MIADLKGKSIDTGAILLYCRASPLSAAASDKPLSNMKFVLIGRLQQSKVRDECLTVLFLMSLGSYFRDKRTCIY